MKKKSIFILCIVLCLVVALAVPAVAKKPRRVAFATFSTKSGAYAFIVAITKAINSRYGNEMQITPVEVPGGSTGATLHLVKREVDIAWTENDIMPLLLKGGGEYMGIKFPGAPDLRFMMLTIANPCTFFVLKETGIKSLYELEGKKFGVSYPGSSTGRVAKQVLDGLGIKIDIFQADIATCVQAAKDRKIVGFAKPGAPDATILEVAAMAPITVLGLTEADLAKIKQKFPEALRGAISAGAYPGQGKDVLTLATCQGFGCNKDFPGDLAYKITEAMWQGRKEIGASYASINRERGILGFPEFTFDGCNGFLHPGAVKWYKDKGYKVPKRLLPPEMK